MKVDSMRVVICELLSPLFTPTMRCEDAVWSSTCSVPAHSVIPGLRRTTSRNIDAKTSFRSMRDQ